MGLIHQFYFYNLSFCGIGGIIPILELNGGNQKIVRTKIKFKYTFLSWFDCFSFNFWFADFKTCYICSSSLVYL